MTYIHIQDNIKIQYAMLGSELKGAATRCDELEGSHTFLAPSNNQYKALVHYAKILDIFLKNDNLCLDFAT